MAEADLTRSTSVDCNFSEAGLDGCNLEQASLQGTGLPDANAARVDSHRLLTRWDFDSTN